MAVTFEYPFSEADLEVVRSIDGRRYDRDRRAWMLPRTQEALDRLSQYFGARLIVDGPQAQTAAVVKAPDSPADLLPLTRPDFQHAADAVLEALRRSIRAREYSRKTERAYLGWARRFFRFSAGRAARLEELNASHVLAFLEHLADAHLAAQSRNQAASALGFMFKEILGRDETGNVPRAKEPRRVPMVLSHREVLRVLRELVGKYFLIAVLLYSAGLRLEECLRLRVKDIDFELRQVLVRDGKGRKDRYAPLALRCVELLRAQIRRVIELHSKDRPKGNGWAPMPGALHRKDPAAGYELGWQFLFPANTINTDPATGRSGRWPLHATAVQREVKRAVRRSGVAKRATCHTFRHSFATEALRGGCDIRTLQQVMGHKDIRTTMIYLHVLEGTGHYIRSPLDRPDDPEDFDSDPVDSPAVHWDLAARQWARGGARSSALRPRRMPQAEPSSE